MYRLRRFTAGQTAFKQPIEVRIKINMLPAFKQFHMNSTYQEGIHILCYETDVTEQQTIDVRADGGILGIDRMSWSVSVDQVGHYRSAVDWTCTQSTPII
jgi:phenolic acid decarboxylase